MNFTQIQTFSLMNKFYNTRSSCSNEFWIYLLLHFQYFFAISSARPGLLSIFFPTLLAALAVAFPTERMKSPNPSACIVWSETMRLLFLLQVEQVPLNSFTGIPVFLLTVISPGIFLVAE